MAIKGEITLNEVSILEVDADPRISGVDAPTGSLVLWDSGGIFYKSGPTSTDWQLQPTIHSGLSGLSADDHIQYLLVNGSRPMSGALNMGTNNITNVGTVDGVTVSAHATRHLPGGADALATAIAVSVGAANTIGTANSFSRSDHVHQGVHALKVGAGGTNRFNDLVLLGTANNISIADDGSGNFSWDLINTAVTPNSYGSATQVSTFTVDAKGRITAASSTTIAIPSTQITDFTEAAQDAVLSVLTDSSSIDFTYDDAGNSATAVVIPGGVNHNALANLTVGDVHTQYLFLSGRAGGQIAYGGTAASNNLTLRSTSNGTKGYITLVDDGGTVGIGLATPASKLHIDSGTSTASAIKLTVGATTGQTATDGFEFGVSSTGVGEIRQRENLGINIYTNNARVANIAATGQFALGADVTPQDITGGGLIPTFQVIGTTATTSQLTNIIYTASTTGAIINIAKSRNATVGSHTILSASDEIGRYQFRGSDGVNFVEAAYMSALIDSTPGVGSMPTRLSFATTPTSSTSAVERLRIDSGGRVIVGSGASAQDITGASSFPLFQIIGTSSVQMAGIQFSADTIGPVFNLLKSRSASVNTQGLVSADDEFGRIQFRGSDGTNFQAGASIRGLVDGTAGTGSMPGRLIFMTTPTASVTPVERMRIIQSGEVGIGNITPTRTLDINGTLRVRGSSPARGRYLYTNDTTGNADWTDPFNIGMQSHFQDDFIGDVVSGVIVGLGWTIATNGGTISSNGNVSGTHPGTAELSTAGSGSSNPTIYQSATSQIIGNGLSILQMLIQTPTAVPSGTQNYVMRIGLGDNVGGTTADFVDGVYFEFPVNGTTTIQCKTSANSTRTTVNSGVTWAASTWYMLEMYITSSNVDYYINGSLVASITTNIPTGGTRNFGPIFRISKTAGTSARILIVDAFRWSKYFDSVRY